MQILTHLKTSEKFKQTPNEKKTEIIIQKFIESCVNLNASIVEPFIDEENIFDEREKYSFLSELHNLFEDFCRNTLGDFIIKVKDTVCNGCQKGKTVKHFEVYNNATNEYSGDFSFLINIENGVLKDICHCTDFEGCKTCTIGGYDNIPGMEVSVHLVRKLKQDFYGGGSCNHHLPGDYAFLGNELIELDESMSTIPWLCDECKELGYCKKDLL